MVWSLVSLVAAAWVVSRLACAAVLAFARRAEFLDVPEGRKTHPRPMPLGGGIGVAAAVAAVGAAAGIAASAPPAWLARLLPEAEMRLSGDLARGAAARLPELLLFAACAGGVWVSGLVDDLRGLGVRTKLAVQAAAAAALCLFFGPDPFRITAFSPAPWLGFLMTVVWIVGVTNAFNFIDNMDGLCATTGAVSSLLFSVLAAQTGQFLIAAAFALLAGSLLGFLPLNWPPARMFLGDAGSLLTGFLIASLSVLFTYYEARESRWVLAAPVLVLAVPLFDMATVLMIRLGRGAPLTVGDRNHFAHRLQALGLSPLQVLAVTAALSVAIGMTATLLYVLPDAAAILALAQAAAILFAVWHLERAGRQRGP